MGFFLRQAIHEVEDTPEKSKVFYVADGYYRITKVQKPNSINMQLKKTTLNRLKDNEEFKLSKRSDVIYAAVKKEKDGYVFTSVISNRSFKKKGSTVVYVIRS